MFTREQLLEKLESLRSTANMVSVPAAQKILHDLIDKFAEKECKLSREDLLKAKEKDEIRLLIPVYKRRAVTVLDRITETLPEIIPAKTPKSQRSDREMVLYAEQMFLREEPTATLFLDALKKINKLGRDYCGMPNGVFICYEMSEKFRNLDLAWIESFVKYLENDLHAAGIVLTQTTYEAAPGAMYTDHLANIKTCDYVLDVITEHNFIYSTALIATQREQVRRRVESTPSQVIPLLVSGDEVPDEFKSVSSHTSASEQYKNFKTNWINNDEGVKTYFQHFCQLIALLYKSRKHDSRELFQPIWDEFLNRVSASTKQILTTGLATEVAIKYKNLEEEQELISIKKRNRAPSSSPGLFATEKKEEPLNDVITFKPIGTIHQILGLSPEEKRTEVVKATASIGCGVR